MAEIPNLKEMVEQIVHDAVKQIRFTVNDKEITLDELGTIIRRYNAMPVVRCGMCKHWTACESEENDCDIYGVCNQIGRLTIFDWFCADGEVGTYAAD
jgi:hypothetical protein